MANRINGRKPLRGLLLPAQDINATTLDKVNSDFTEQNGRPGIDYPGSASDKTLIQMYNAQKDDISFNMLAGGLTGSSSIAYAYKNPITPEVEELTYRITNTDGAVTSGSTTFTSSGSTFLSTDVGSYIYIASGSNAGYYQVISYTSATVVVVDRAFPITDSSITFQLKIPSYRGWNPPNLMQGFYPVHVSTSTDYNKLDAVTIPSTGKVVCVYSQDTSTYLVQAKIFDPSTATWSASPIQIAATDVKQTVAICIDPSNERLFCFIIAGNSASAALRSQYATGVCYISDDGGLTWSLWSKNFLPAYIFNSAVPAQRGKLRAIMSGGVISLFHQFYTGAVYYQIQWVSSDFANSFQTQYSRSSGFFGLPGNMSAQTDYFQYKSGKIGIVTIDQTDNKLYIRNITNGAALSNAAATVADDTSTFSADVDIFGISGFTDYDGTSYLVVQDVYRAYMYLSTDEGDSWAKVITGPTFLSTSNNQGLANSKIVSTCGYSLMIGSLYNTVYGSGNLAGSLVSLKLGGWSNITLRSIIGSSVSNLIDQDKQSRPGFGASDDYTTIQAGMWYPIDTPENIDGFTEVTSGGASTETLETSTSAELYLKVAHTAGGSTTRYWYGDTGSTTFGFIGIYANCYVQTGGSTVVNQVGYIAELDNGTDQYRVEVNFSTTQLGAVDKVGAFTSTAVTLDAGTYYDTMLFVSDSDPTSSSSVKGYFELYYKKETDVIWKQVPPGGITNGLLSRQASSGTATATDGVTLPGTRSTVYFGHTVASTSASRWKAFAYMFKDSQYGFDDFGTNISSYYKNLVGKRTSAYTYPLAEISSTNPANSYSQQFFKARNGPSYLNEKHTVKRSFDYPIENILYDNAPSPRQKWRSQEQLTDGIGGSARAGLGGLLPAVDMEFDLGNNTNLNSTSLAIFFSKHNFLQAYLEGKQENSTSWTVLGTYYSYLEFSAMTGVVSGNIISPTPGSQPQSLRYIHRNEFAEAEVYVVVSGTPYYFKILSNTEGWWGGSGKQAQLKLDFDGSDIDFDGTAVLTIKPHTSVFIMHNVTNKYSRFRVTIPTQSVAMNSNENSYFYEAGLIMVGAFQPLGQQWGFASTYELQPNSETTRNSFGTTRTRKLGDPIPRWTINYTDGMDQANLKRNGDYLSAEGNNPLATYRDVGSQLNGILDELKSGEVPCVILSSVPISPDSFTITDPRLFLYSRLASSIVQEKILGEEGRDEVIRLGTLTFEGVI